MRAPKFPDLNLRGMRYITTKNFAEYSPAIHFIFLTKNTGIFQEFFQDPIHLAAIVTGSSFLP